MISEKNAQKREEASATAALCATKPIFTKMGHGIDNRETEDDSTVYKRIYRKCRQFLSDLHTAHIEIAFLFLIYNIIFTF